MRKRNFPLPVSFLFVFIISIFFQNCVKDHCTSQYTFWEPVYRSKAEVRANIKSNSPREIERPGKIYIRGNYIFLNETDRGIHIIDNSNPASPRIVAFIDIPGNLDMAVKGNILYADFYTELVAIDITDPLHAVVKKFTENIFPERTWGNGFSPNPSMAIVDWVQKDTIVEMDCGGSPRIFNPLRGGNVFFSDQAALSGSAAAAPTPFGAGGSMARFTIVNNHLYAVSQSALNVVSISNPEDPVFNNRVILSRIFLLSSKMAIWRLISFNYIFKSLNNYRAIQSPNQVIGNLRCTEVPLPGSDSIFQVPFISAARIPILRSPLPDIDCEA